MKIRTLVILALLTSVVAKAQNTDEWIGQESSLNTITTAVPFLMIAPDARSGGMGESGVATSPDANSMHWNPAKYAFIDKQMGFAMSYSPWLRALVNDINLAYVSGFYKLDDRQAIAATLLYFSLGDITFTNDQGQNLGVYRPNEFTFDAAYSRKFSDYISGSVAARFIYSNLTQGQYVGGLQTKPGTSIAADVAMYYTRDIDMGNMDGNFSFGVNISNIGAKISYTDNADRDFIPTNLRFGPSIKMIFDDYNELTFTVDVNKLLVPTPPIYATDSTGKPVLDPATNEPVIFKGKDPNVSVVPGMIQSFYDAPGGFNEEMREFSFATGIEYWYDQQFAIRGGFFYEDRTKGNRKFFTLGAGLRYNVFGLDFAYLIPIEQQNPLENTLRFTLHFNFEAFEKQNN